MDQPAASKRGFTPVLLLLLLLPGLPVLAADKVAVANMIVQAEQKQQEARSAEHAWSVTNGFIEEARTLLDAGEVDAAAAMAQQAVEAAEASLEQATAEAAAWQARVPGS